VAERSIVDVINALRKYRQGLRPTEHPLYGGVTKGVHSPTSYHYAPGGAAVDIGDFGPDVGPVMKGLPDKTWQQRTGELAWRAKQLKEKYGIFDEVYGPGDKGHDTHVHLALAGKKNITDDQLRWLATGRWGDKELTDVMPPAINQQPAVQQPVEMPKVSQQGDTFIYLPSSALLGSNQNVDDLLSLYKQEILKSKAQPIQSMINPAQMLMSAFNQTPNYLA